MEIKLEVIRFGPQDIIATSGIGRYFSMPVNDMALNQWYLILNGEGAKAYGDWYYFPSHYDYDGATLILVSIKDGDWFNDRAPGDNNIADQNNPAHTSLIYIWYGSGYGRGNVNFNTQNQPWSYYLDNNIPLSTSTQ